MSLSKESSKDTYIIRIYDQDLHINTEELVDDLKNNGLDIVRAAFSYFGACYFFEVRGTYSGEIELERLEEKANDFDWNV